MTLSTNIASGDTNGGTPDVVVYDRVAGTAQIASVKIGGGTGNGQSYNARISADGRFVAFASDASNLVTGDTNGARDIFVRDLCVSNGSAVPSCTPVTERVSVQTGGGEATGGTSDAPGMSADGRFVVFRSQATNLVMSDGDSDHPAVSADGRYVAFDSQAGTLSPDDQSTNTQLFLRDRDTGQTELISPGTLTSSGGSPSLSADGRYVAYEGAGVMVFDRVTRSEERQALNSGPPSLSADGRYVAFFSTSAALVPSDTNGAADIFVRDRLTGVIERMSVTTNGAQTGGADRVQRVTISADGSAVGFDSGATDIVPSDGNGFFDVFIRGTVFSQPASDLTDDGALDDKVLKVVDTTVGPPAAVSVLCPAGQAAVANGAVAFLRPEAALFAVEQANAPKCLVAITGGGRVPAVGLKTSREDDPGTLDLGDLILKDKERTQPDKDPRPSVAIRRVCHAYSRDD